MPEQKLPFEFCGLTFNPTAGRYDAILEQSAVGPLRISIAADDLVWDDVWTSILGEGWIHADEGFLVDYLSYESIEFDGDSIHVWVDTAGLHTDHKARATINDAMQIEICELM